MTPKEYLEKCIDLEHDYKTIERQKEISRSSLLGISKLRDDKVSSTPTTSVEDRVLEWVEWSDKLDDALKELNDYKFQVMREIIRLDNSLQRRVLQSIYIDGNTMKDVAKDICYSLRQTHRFYKQGLEEFAALYPEKFSK